MRALTLNLLLALAILVSCAQPPKGKADKEQARVKPTPQAQSKPDELTKVRQWLWPRQPQPWPSVKKSPAKAVTPKAEPAVKPAPAPKAAEAAPPSRPPPAPAAAAPRKTKRQHGPKASGSAAGQPKPSKPRAAAVVKDDGPDLPYPCWLVKAHAAGKTRAQLEAEGRAHGIALSAKQRRQAAACLK